MDKIRKSFISISNFLCVLHSLFSSWHIFCKTNQLIQIVVSFFQWNWWQSSLGLTFWPQHLFLPDPVPGYVCRHWGPESGLAVDWRGRECRGRISGWSAPSQGRSQRDPRAQSQSQRGSVSKWNNLEWPRKILQLLVFIESRVHLIGRIYHVDSVHLCHQVVAGGPQATCRTPSDCLENVDIPQNEVHQ